MSEPTLPLAEFGTPPQTAQMQAGRTTAVVVNLRATKDANSAVVARLQPGVQVWCGKSENGMTPVRLEGWISDNLVTA